MSRPDDSLQFLIEMRNVYVNIATGIMLFWPGQWKDDLWFGPGQGQRIYSPKCPDKLWELQNHKISYSITTSENVAALVRSWTPNFIYFQG